MNDKLPVEQKGCKKKSRGTKDQLIIDKTISCDCSNREDIPKWMALGERILFQKDSSKGNAVDNYRSISCLPLMWTLVIELLLKVFTVFLM